MNASPAALAEAVARQYAPRTAERRAAAALHTALVTTKTAEAARKALATFADPVTRAAAAALLEELTRENT